MAHQRPGVHRFPPEAKISGFQGLRGKQRGAIPEHYDDSSDTARYGGWLNGPQVDIHGPVPFRCGLIYDETENVQRWIFPSLPDWQIVEEQAPKEALKTSLFYFEDDPEAWNELEIICEAMM